MTADAPYRVVPADRFRRIVARRLRQVVADKPHVTLHARADAQALLAARQRLATGTQVRTTLTVLLMQLTARALREYPRLNGRTEDDEIRLYGAVNLSVAVALDDGLVAPVIKDADRKGTSELTAELRDVSSRARSGALRSTDLTDGTFTVSNLGAHGVEWFTPIINPPQLAILGVGAIRDEPRCLDGAWENMPVLYLSLSFDHAAVDGAQAARFLSLVKRHVESPDPVFADEPRATDRRTPQEVVE